jgi:serine/threonine protein kinase
MPPDVPDYELLQPIGHGAYGEVWLGRDVLGIFRAVKIIRRKSFQDSAPFDREYRGIQHYTPISRTHHGLLQILRVGRNREQSYFYYVMELGDCEVNGQKVHPESYRARNLEREIDCHRHMTVAECIQLAIELAEPLQHLHSRQLLHRDIKPSNIIFVGGVPKFADVGMITHAAEKGDQVVGLGTEGFVAPEGPSSPSADVYSLAKVLLETLMGRSTSPTELANPALRTELGDAGAAKLLAIIQRACDPDPEQRHQTVVEFQADLLSLTAEGSG